MQLMTKEHALASIERNRALPMTKQPIPNESPDDRTTGTLFAQEIIALQVGQAVTWGQLAHRAFGMTIEARKVTMERLDKWLKAKREETSEVTDVDDKTARKRVNSATTQLSNMRTIMHALNAGMTYETLAAYHKCNDPENLGFAAIVELARTFSKSTAGRKPDTLLVKLGKWLEVQKKGTPETAEERQLLDDLIKFYNNHTKD